MTRKLRPPRGIGCLAAGFGLAMAASTAVAADDQKSFEVYGFAQLDYIQDFGRVDPDWESTLRPTRIPTSGEPFGSDGQAILSVRQSRLGVKATLPTAAGPINTRFEFDLFGVGDDAGQTTFRLRHAYGEFGQFLAGQTNSTFMDIDTFPNVVDYWGPTGMVFYRNVQIRWTPIADGSNTIAVALEDPGNDIDQGKYSRQLEQGGFAGQSDEQYPDLTAHWRRDESWGHFQVAGILRKVGVEIVDTATSQVGYSDDDIGWGVNLTSNIKVGARDVVHLGLVFGEGIASYMNDGGMDAAPDRDPAAPGVQVEAVPLTGVLAYYDHYWNDRFSSSIGYSYTEVDNTDGQTADAYNKGQYASANLLYTPVENVLVGAELLWGEREDNGGNSGDDTRLQFTFKYNFSTKL